jgi:hypothetical protein
MTRLLVLQARTFDKSWKWNTSTFRVRFLFFHVTLSERDVTRLFSYCSPIGAPGSSKGRSRPSGLSKTPSTGGKGRSRNTRSTGGVDPQGLVGRRIWRYYPDEDPQSPWVEGFLTDYDTHSNTYTILYDPNTAKETTEGFFDLDANNPVCINVCIICTLNYCPITWVPFILCRVNMF